MKRLAPLDVVAQTRPHTVFKPALRDGHPVDHAATLRVLFQLA